MGGGLLWAARHDAPREPRCTGANLKTRLSRGRTRTEVTLSKCATVMAQTAVPTSMTAPPSSELWDTVSRGLQSRANVAQRITTYGSSSRAMFLVELTSLSLASCG